MNLTLDEIAKRVDGTVAGDGRTVIRGVNGLKEAGPGEISFLANRKYASLLDSTRASAVIVVEGMGAPIPSIAVKNPDLAFARVAEIFVGGASPFTAGIHATAVVAPGASLGRDVSIGAHAVVEEGASVGDGTVLAPQVYVGRGARIGPGCLLYPQVVVRERCVLGARVILHSGAVVGSDGFGYATEDGVHQKIPQTGIVVIEDDVEIGAGTTVDRARFGRTLIRKGTKIDNLVQVAHNVEIGEHCLLAAQTGIAGSTRVGHHVMMGGQVGVTGHLELGDGAIATAQSGVDKSVPPGAVVSGSPARPRQQHLRGLASVERLSEALREIRKLRQELEELRQRLAP
jgi:UDP-3-O-[3-hydroxymyristoyl] glucosamine N-acyltransferase